MRQPQDFEGTWRIDRQLTDHMGAMSGTLSGTATLRSTGEDGALDYAEEGTLRLVSGAVLHAQRAYRWEWRDAAIAVFFEDGTPFHAFTPIGIGAGTAHLCGVDLYDVTYDFSHWPEWHVIWHVTGPRKNYVSLTTYTRV